MHASTVQRLIVVGGSMRLIIFRSQASLHNISLLSINPINHTNSDNGNELAPFVPYCKILLPCRMTIIREATLSIQSTHVATQPLVNA